MAYVNIAYARSVQDRISSLDQNTVLVDYRGGWEENKERKQSSTPGFVGLFFDFFFFLSLTVVIFPSTQHFTAPTVVYQHPDEVPETPTSPSAYYCSKTSAVRGKKGGGKNPNKPSQNQATELRNKTATRQTPPPPERGMKPGSPLRLPRALRRRGRPSAAGGARGRPGGCHQPQPPAPALRPGGLPPQHRPGARRSPPAAHLHPATGDGEGAGARSAAAGLGRAGPGVRGAAGGGGAPPAGRAQQGCRFPNRLIRPGPARGGGRGELPPGRAGRAGRGEP